MLTGTAAWNFVAISQWILGIRPEHDGLRIDPRVPAAWETFTMTRKFRDATYRICIRGGCAGRVKRLLVDGVPVKGNVAPLPSRTGQEIVVEAEIEP